MLRPGLNTNPIDVIGRLPVIAGAGALIITDPRGTRGDAFIMLAADSWWRLDLTSRALQRLPNPPAGLVFGAGVAACWDATGSNIYVIGPGAGGGLDSWFARYAVGTGVWAAMNSATLDALLPGVISLDSALAHPCTTIGAAASDDFIYWTGGANAAASLIFARYTIAGNIWTNVPPANRAVAAGAGATLIWPWGHHPDRLTSLDGGGVGTGEWYTIAGNAWAAEAFLPPFTALPAAGTCARPSTDGKYVYIRLNATGTILRYDRLTTAVDTIGQLSTADGAATAGGKFCVYRTDGAEFLVCLLNGSTQIQRIQIVT